MELNPVYSSHVEAIGYDPVSQELRVRWQSGRESIYHGVPPEIGSDFHKRASIGEALKSVKASYRHTYA